MWIVFRIWSHILSRHLARLTRTDWKRHLNQERGCCMLLIANSNANHAQIMFNLTPLNTAQTHTTHSYSSDSHNRRVPLIIPYYRDPALKYVNDAPAVWWKRWLRWMKFVFPTERYFPLEPTTSLTNLKGSINRSTPPATLKHSNKHIRSHVKRCLEKSQVHWLW